MKEINKVNKKSLFKKLFIKVCRMLNYEIIDQNNFYLPVTKQNLDEDLSIAGKRSLTIPMGNVEITRKVKSLTIILRSCTSVQMLTQSKKRIFDSEKSEYTLRTLNSLINSLNFSKDLFNNISLDLVIVDHNSDQNIIDNQHKDLRRARAAAQSVIPTKTGAAKAVGLVLPELNGKLDGFAMRVPTLNVSTVDLTFTASRNTTVEEVNEIIKKASDENVLAYNDEPLVSIDFNHHAASSIFDATQTRVIGGNLVKIVTWYDNEWGFSCRMIDTALAMMKA